jgi:hypothetical protein
MKWILILISIVIIFSLPVTAAEIGIEPDDGAYLLVFTSGQPLVISAYTVQLDYDPSIPVMGVSAVEPFDVFSKINPEEGFLRISAFAMTPHNEATRVPLARIIAGSGFSPSIRIECLDDFDQNPIPTQGGTSPEPTEKMLPEYQTEVYLPPVGPAPAVPNEVRRAWALPVELSVPGTMVTVSPTVTPEVIVATPTTGGTEEVLSPSGEVPVAQIPVSDPTFESTEIPVSKTPLPLVQVIGGLLIVMLIIWSRE